MIGHDSGKRGNWYEEEYIVLQLLRLLLGELRSVTWEVAHEDGEGIDCLLEDNEGSIAVQCKTKSTGSWTLRQLEKGGVLRHVADRLEGREDLRFRFVSDAPCRDLRKACEGARSAPDVGTWWKNLAEETKRTLQNSWALPEGAEGAAKAYRLARGIEVELLDTKGLDLHLNDLALALSPESKRLVQVLRRFARGSLTRRLREPEIRRQLEKDGVPLHPRPNDPAVHDRLEALTRGYLDKVWEREHPFSRDPLLDLLASVSRQWPDGVAKHLERWQAKEPTTLEWASHVFTAAPGEDSDALFEVRMEYLARNAGDDPYWDWTKLFQQAPGRAVRLLEVLLTRADVDVLTPNGPVWTSRLPAPAKLPPEAAKTGRLIWDHLRAWWLAFDLRAGLLLVPTAGGVLEEGALPRLVELIAAGLAHELATNPAFLQSLLGEMPSPLRELDAWLLLRVGARLPEHATEAADAMARWFMSDLRWARIEIGPTGSSKGVSGFIERVGTAVSDDVFRELELYLVEYQDPWTREDEEKRSRLQAGFGMDVPSRPGRTAHRLLSHLPAERLSPRAQRTLAELHRKFDPTEGNEPILLSGYVRSNVPDDVAARWSMEEWLACLRDPRLLDHRGSPSEWTSMGPGSIGVYSLSAQATQLGSLAKRDPRRYLPLALRMEPDIPWQAREKLLYAISRRQRPNELPAGKSWAPLEDEEVAMVLLLPAYFDEPAIGRLLAWVVGERPGYQWPEKIRERLVQVARGEVRPGISPDQGLTNYRLNENGCAALDAIAALVRYHRSLRAWALKIAGELVTHDDAGRRAGAGAIAAACLEKNTPDATRLLFQAATDPLVAAEREVTQGLFRLALGGEEAEESVRERAIVLLLAMVGHANEYVASSGGRAAVWLRHRSVIGDGEIEKVLEAGVPTRRGMARVVQQLLIGSPPPPWLQKLAVELVSDTDQQTARTVLFAFLKPEIDPLFAEHAFIRQLIEAASDVGHDLAPIVEACDRQIRLLPAARVVLRMAEELAGAPEKRRWREADELTGLLARLVEESEREQDFGLRNRTLDAWDSLLEASVPLAHAALAVRLDET